MNSMKSLALKRTSNIFPFLFLYIEATLSFSTWAFSSSSSSILLSSCSFKTSSIVVLSTSLFDSANSPFKPSNSDRAERSCDSTSLT